MQLITARLIVVTAAVVVVYVRNETVRKIKQVSSLMFIYNNEGPLD